MVNLDINQLIETAKELAEKASTLDEVRQAKAQLLGKKGTVTALFKQLKDLPPAEKPAFAQRLQELRSTVEEIFQNIADTLEAQQQNAASEAERIDVTLPGRQPATGALHPVEKTGRVILAALKDLGFSVRQGPEVEETQYNFDALNFPADHPARDMQDTFFLAPQHKDTRGEPLLLRTHTSPVQIRTMLTEKPPLRIAVPGKVFRCDADVTHSPMFHQIEGFWVDEKVTFRDLKGVLHALLEAIFGRPVKVRFRSSFFPFTEPSAEVDMGCLICEGEGCRVCADTGWLEVLGCGMIHPNVLRAGGIDPDRYQGFAFGLGVDRFAMFRYRTPDIRLLYESDARFLRNFVGELVE